MTSIPQEIRVNGCDFWPDGSWKECCDVHDIEFYTPGNFTDFLASNYSLFQCVNENSFFVNAIVMFIGVMVGGAFVWKWKGLNNRSIFEVITGKEY